MLGGGSGIQPLRMRDSESGLFSAYNGTNAYDLIFDKTDFVVDRSTLYKVKVNTTKFVDTKWMWANPAGTPPDMLKIKKGNVYAITGVRTISSPYSTIYTPIFMVEWSNSNVKTIELTSSSSVSGDTFLTRTYYLSISEYSSDTGLVYLKCRNSSITKGIDGTISFSETTENIPYYYRKVFDDKNPL